ncbi:MAG: PorV/PorQ family protein [Elusimicrobiota bacterium]
MKNIFSAILISLAANAFAAEQPTALFLLDAQPNIRLYSMGGVLSSLGQTDAAYNPWELGYTVNPSVSLAHWPGAVLDSNYNFVSALVPSRKLGTLSLSYLNYGTGSEKFEELDGTTRSIKLEDDKLITLGYGRAITQRLFAGLSLKSLTSTLAEDYKASAMLMDFGLVYRTLDDKHSVGLAMVNYGSGLKYYQTQEPLPTEIKLGYTRKTKPWANQKIVWGLGYAKSQVSQSYSMGAEYFPGIPFVSLRAGLNKGDEETKFMAGLGFNYNALDLDLGYDLTTSKMEDAQAPLRFALTWSFGERDAYSLGEKYMSGGMKDKAVALWEDIRKQEPMYAQARDAIDKYAYQPQLVLKGRLEDTDGDGILSPNESGNIVVILSNEGRGKATGIWLNVAPINPAKAKTNLEGGFYSAQVRPLDPGSKTAIQIPVKAADESETGPIAFRMEAIESRGFNPEAAAVGVRLKGMSPPYLAMARYTFSENFTGRSEGNSNGIIDAGETIELTGFIVNAGLSDARAADFALVSKEPKITVINSGKTNFGTLKPGESRKVSAVFKIDKGYSTEGRLPLYFSFKEARPRFAREQQVKLDFKGFYQNAIEPVFAEFDTASLLSALPGLPGPIPAAASAGGLIVESKSPPSLDFDQAILTDGDINGDGIYQPGETLKVKIAIRNTGGQTANGVKVEVSGNKAVQGLFGEVVVGDVQPGAEITRILTAIIPETMPSAAPHFSIKVTEASGFNARKVEEVVAVFQPKDIEKKKEPEQLLPVPFTNYGQLKKAGAIVVGVGKYKRVSGLQYPALDAKAVKSYLSGVMGIPAENIKTFTDDDASKSTIDAAVKNWLIKKDFDTIVFYFAGHGIPDPDNPRDGPPFIVPYDGDLDPSLGKGTLINLKDLISDMEGSKAKNVFVLLDSCFSGMQGRTPDQYATTHRGLVVAAKFDQQRAFVFAGSKGNQASFDFDKTKHGYFTYYMLLGLKGYADKPPYGNNDGAVTDTELCAYVAGEMSAELEGRQTPECSNATGQVLGRYR